MDILLQNHSSYPRTNERPAGAAAVIDVEPAATGEVLEIQTLAELDIVTDGQLRWPDPVSYVMGALDGVHLGDVRRYFGTGLSFRQPVITASIHRRTALVRDDFSRAAALTRRRVKPILPGPYTLARCSTIASGPYRDSADLAYALSTVLAAEVRDLVAAGADIIQIEEPAILSFPGDIRLLRRLLEPLWDARGTAELVLATYCGDAAPLYAELNSLPADLLALDVCSSPDLIEVIAATGASKTIALGIVDGRTATLEDPARVAHQVESALLRYTLDTLHLVPSCGLGYLPRPSARAKLDLLSQIRRLVTASDCDRPGSHARRVEDRL